MQKLGSIHLYLGCIFAPLLMCFAVSGIWQTFRIKSPWLERLSTVHTADRLKDGTELGGASMKVLVMVMAVSFIATTILGVVMALRFGRSRRTALICLAAGVAVPAVLVALRRFGA